MVLQRLARRTSCDPLALQPFNPSTTVEFKSQFWFLIVQVLHGQFCFISSDIMDAWGASKSEWESLKVAAWESSDASAKDDACEPDTQVGTYAEGVNLAIERFFDEDSQL